MVVVVVVITEQQTHKPVPIISFSARETIWVLMHPDTAVEIAKPGYRYPMQYYLVSVMFFVAVIVPASLIDNLSSV